MLDLHLDVHVLKVVDFLLDGGGSETKYSRSFALYAVDNILVKEEISHNEIVEMTLVSMVTLIKNNHIKLLNLNKAVLQDIIKLFFSEDENIKLLHLISPIFVLFFTWERF